MDWVIDCVFSLNRRGTVVDFKTDREAAADFAVYRRQACLYAAAVTQVMSRPVRAVLLQL